MGWGNWCLIAKGFGCEVYGIEFESNRMEHAVRLGIQPVDWQELESQRYDFINAEQVFEHLTDPVPVLLRLKACLAEGGIIRINVPSGNEIKRRIQMGDWRAGTDSDRSLNDIAPLQHVNCFCGHALDRLAEIVGLQAVPVEKLNSQRHHMVVQKVERIIRRGYRTLRRAIKQRDISLITLPRSTRSGLIYMQKGETTSFSV